MKITIDSLLFLIGGIVWILVSIYYAVTGLMIEGTRVWAAGAVIFLLIFLAVWYAERRGRTNSNGTKRAASEKPRSQLTETEKDNL